MKSHGVRSGLYGGWISHDAWVCYSKTLAKNKNFSNNQRTTLTAVLVIIDLSERRLLSINTIFKSQHSFCVILMDSAPLNDIIFNTAHSCTTLEHKVRYF